MKRDLRAFVVTLLAAAMLIASHEFNMAQTRDINAVLAAHDKELMSIPNVVGVYIGVLDDKKTPCLKIMLARKSAETESAIPHSLEGYPVVTEVTGQIRPLDH